MSIYLEKRGLTDRVVNQEVYDKVAKKHKITPFEVERILEHHCRFAMQEGLKKGFSFIFRRLGMFKLYKRKTPITLKK